MTRKVDPTQVRKDEIHRRVAAEIRRDSRVIQQAAARLDRWMRRSGDPPDPALVEWTIALTSLDAGQLADFLESPTPRAQRMRISSPFFWPAR
jgi:hypothetical protein